MIRTTLIPETQTIQFNIPKDYVGKEIEVIAFEVGEVGKAAVDEEKENTMAQFWGVMSDETASYLKTEIEISKTEWNNNI